MAERYAVMGNPIAHSKSPKIHSEFAKQTHQLLSYRAQLVELDGFVAAVNNFFTEGGKGLNITVPFKQEAWAMAQQRSPQAELAGAVNTLYLDKHGRLQGHNTDGIGLVRDIKQNHHGVLAGKRILIVGAGGATRGILLPFLDEKPALVCIANRTMSKSEELVKMFSSYGKVHASSFEQLLGQQFDWVFNASASSLEGEVPPLPKEILAANASCYDLMYGNELTLFCRWAKGHGVKQVLDGLGMLVEQAAESFYTWRGVRPDTAPVLAAMRHG